MIQDKILNTLNTLGAAGSIAKGLEEQKKQTEQAVKQTAAQEKANKLAEQQAETAENIFKSKVTSEHTDQMLSLTDDLNFDKTIDKKTRYKKYQEVLGRIKDFENDPATIIRQKYINGEIKDRATYENEMSKVKMKEAGMIYDLSTGVSKLGKQILEAFDQLDKIRRKEDK